MEKRGSDQLMMTISLILILALFLILMYAFVSHQKNSAAIGEGAYVSEIVKVIDSAKEKDEITIDIHKATEIAQKNDVSDLRETFFLNQTARAVCSRLSLGRMSCLSYFNDLKIEGFEVVISPPRNLLKIKIGGKYE